MSVSTVLRAQLAALSICCAFLPASASAATRHDRTEAAIIRAMNHVRISHRLPALRTSRGLARAADAHSASMARSRTLSHGSFSRRVRRYVRTRMVGENIAWMSGCDAGAVVRMWLNSAAHRRIMLERGFRRVGVGRRAASSLCFITADFASAR
jgi:uncharacterized protein YkwD